MATTIENAYTNILKHTPLKGYAKGDRIMIIGGHGPADGLQTMTACVLRQLNLVTTEIQ